MVWMLAVLELLLIRVDYNKDKKWEKSDFIPLSFCFSS